MFTCRDKIRDATWGFPILYAKILAFLKHYLLRDFESVIGNLTKQSGLLADITQLYTVLQVL